MKIRIDGIKPYDGEYDLDVSFFTNRELHRIKKLTGLRAGELEDAMAAGDTDLVVALAVVGLERGGHTDVNVDRIWDAPVGGLSFVADEADVEDDAGPPGVSDTKLRLERELFRARFRDEFGEFSEPPERYWDARVGFFGVAVGEVGDLTPEQLLGCADMFAALHGTGDR